MILFLEDWNHYPTSVWDLNTSNKSFVRYAKLLKDMGVKNYLFPLSLMQPEIAGLSPYQKDLTVYQKVLMKIETQCNPWYFFREVARVPPIASKDPEPLTANRGNISLYWLFLNHIDVFLEQIRQTGKTTAMFILAVWLLFFRLDQADVGLVTKASDLKTEAVTKIKAMRDYLPQWMIVQDPTDADNQTTVTYKTKGTRFKISIGQSTETGANNVGRGLTMPVLLCDEGPFVKNVHIIIPASLGSLNTAREKALAAGQPTGIVFGTTSGKLDSVEGAFMHRMISRSCPWTEMLYDCKDYEDLLETVIANTQDEQPAVSCVFTHQQLGYSDEWLLSTLKRVRSEGQAADRDFFLVWSRGAEGSPLSPELNAIIAAAVTDSQYKEISAYKYIIDWFIPKDERDEYMKNGQFILGCDTSEAVGRDDIALVLLDLKDLSVVATVSLNETYIPKFSQFVVEFLLKYETITFIPERKSTGIVLIDALLMALPSRGINPFKRIYNKIVNERERFEDDYRYISRGTPSEEYLVKNRTMFGFSTTSETRDVLFVNTLPNAAKMAGHLVRSRKLSNQIRGLVTKNGRIDHKASGHDDLVIGWLLAVWMVTSSSNLSFYGINTDLILTHVTMDNKELTDEDVHGKQVASQIRLEIDGLREKLAKTQVPALIMVTEKKLSKLIDEYNHYGNETLSWTDLVTEARNARRSRNAERQRTNNIGLMGRRAAFRHQDTDNVRTVYH